MPSSLSLECPQPTLAQSITPYRHHHLFGLNPGDMLAEYRIDRPLGRGGMGVVFAAWDTAADRPVALKVLGWAITDEHVIARFHREAALPTRVRHPGIVEVYGIGQTADLCFLIMEHVDGVSLRDWMTTRGRSSTPGVLSPNPNRFQQTTQKFSIRFDAATPVNTRKADVAEKPRSASAICDAGSLRRVAEMLRELADALAFAHAAGVTHRDVKPENVIVRADGRVVLIDFGLARAYTDSTLTSCSGLIGTPLYMAPEQLAGQPASPLSDVYALGLVGYELLSGSLPFQSSTIECLLDEVLHKPLPPVTGRNPAVPAGLANIIHKATSKKPRDRYASAAEMREDLDRYLSDQLVTANHYQYRFNSRELIAVRPRRLTVAAYLVALFGGALSLYGLFSMAFNARLGAMKSVTGGMFFIVAALWIFSGRRGSLTLGFISTLTLSAMASWIVWNSFNPDVRHISNFVIAPLIVLPTTVAGILFTALVSPRSREWLRMVREKRRQFVSERKPHEKVNTN